MSANNSSKAAPPTPQWDSAPIIGYSGKRAGMRTEKQEWNEAQKGKLAIVASGLQFTGTSVLRVPFSELKLVFPVKGSMNRFGITTRKEETYYFKVFDAPGYVAHINQLWGDPSLRKTGGVPGTPRQVMGFGLILVVIGPIMVILGILGFVYLLLFLTWVLIAMLGFGVAFTILGIRAIMAGRHAAKTTQPIQG